MGIVNKVYCTRYCHIFQMLTIIQQLVASGDVNIGE